MPRKLVNTLTPLTVKNARSGRHADGGGLHLLVKKSGAKSWVFRFMLRGKSHDIGLGAAAGLGAKSLAEARDDAAVLRIKVRRGTDPLEERALIAAEAKEKAKAELVASKTFRDVAEDHIAKNQSTWLNAKHRQQWSNTLATYVYDTFGDTPVAKVDTSHVLKVLEPIWKTKPETADRLRGRIETILDSARAQGYRAGENPARWRNHLQLILPPKSRLSRGHHRAMPFKDVAALCRTIQARDAVGALALEFTILTAARTGETIGATWEEIDLDQAIWSVQAHRMKAKKPHRVPLSPRAIEILKEAQVLDNDWVFPNRQGYKMSNMSMSMLLRRMGSNFTVHGFRSSFRDWAAECTEHANEVVEMALSHVIKSGVERAYRRGDLLERRRPLMEQWAAYCLPVEAADQQLCMKKAA